MSQRLNKKTITFVRKGLFNPAQDLNENICLPSLKRILKFTLKTENNS